MVLLPVDENLMGDDESGNAPFRLIEKCSDYFFNNPEFQSCMDSFVKLNCREFAGMTEAQLNGFDHELRCFGSLF